MLAILALAIVASTATSYLVGSALVARTGSFWKTKKGSWTLVLLVTSIVLLPPQLLLLPDKAAPSVDLPAGVPASVATGGIPVDLAVWPQGVSRSGYTIVWLIAATIALLVGMRVWERRGAAAGSAGVTAFDTSAAGRARALLPLQDHLSDVLDVLARTRVDARAAATLGPEMRDAGRRFASELPANPGEAYRLVAQALPPAVASVITRPLIEGATEARTPEAPPQP